MIGGGTSLPQPGGAGGASSGGSGCRLAGLRSFNVSFIFSKFSSLIGRTEGAVTSLPEAGATTGGVSLSPDLSE